MGTSYNPPIVTDGLVFCVDAANQRSYPKSGTTWSDLVGANNGTMQNMEDNYSSDNGGVLNFDGADEYVALGNASSVIPSNASITVGGWLRPDTTGSYKTIFSTVAQSSQTITGPWMAIGPSSFPAYFGIKTDVAQSYVTDFNGNYLSTTEFTHFYGTYDGSYLKLYRNGSFIRAAAHSGNIGNAGVIRISGYDNGALNFDGAIGMFSIYNRALTDDEVRQNYEATVGRFT